MQRDLYSKPTPLHPGAAIAIPGAFIARSGAIDVARQNNRPVHGGILWRGADNSARAQRRRIAREAARAARKGGAR